MKTPVASSRPRLPDGLDFADTDDVPIPYLQRIRDYYLGLGYGNPYVFAHYHDVPFTPLTKPLARSRIGLIVTAAPYQEGKGDQRPNAPPNGDVKFYKVYSGDTRAEHKLTISHVAVDRDHTTSEDQGIFFPLHAMRRAQENGSIGAIAPRFHGAPTNRSHRITLAQDVPELVARCREDGCDGVILVPNCPVCHQTVALAARALETAGIASVVMGCAKDIVEHVGVPRFVFSDFPLGNACGKPGDVASQDATLALALRLLESAPGARTTVQSPQRWSADPTWKLDYSNIARLSAQEIARRRAEFDAVKAKALDIKRRDGAVHKP